MIGISHCERIFDNSDMFNRFETILASCWTDRQADRQTDGRTDGIVVILIHASIRD